MLSSIDNFYRVFIKISIIYRYKQLYIFPGGYEDRNKALLIIDIARYLTIAIVDGIFCLFNHFSLDLLGRYNENAHSRFRNYRGKIYRSNTSSSDNLL